MKKSIFKMIAIFLGFYLIFQGYLTSVGVLEDFTKISNQYITFGSLVNSEENLDLWMNNLKWSIGSSELIEADLIKSKEARVNDKQFWIEESSFYYEGNTLKGQILTAEYLIVDIEDEYYNVKIKAKAVAPFLRPIYIEFDLIDDEMERLLNK